MRAKQRAGDQLKRFARKFVILNETGAKIAHETKNQSRFWPREGATVNERTAWSSLSAAVGVRPACPLRGCEFYQEGRKRGAQRGPRCAERLHEDVTVAPEPSSKNPGDPPRVGVRVMARMRSKKVVSVELSRQMRSSKKRVVRVAPILTAGEVAATRSPPEEGRDVSRRQARTGGREEGRGTDRPPFSVGQRDGQCALSMMRG